jgi:hypothetical protein
MTPALLDIIRICASLWLVDPQVCIDKYEECREGLLNMPKFFSYREVNGECERLMKKGNDEYYKSILGE